MDLQIAVWHKGNASISFYSYNLNDNYRTNAWTDTDHTAYTLSTVRSVALGLLSLTIIKGRS